MHICLSEMKKNNVFKDAQVFGSSYFRYWLCSVVGAANKQAEKNLLYFMNVE